MRVAPPASGLSLIRGCVPLGVPEIHVEPDLGLTFARLEGQRWTTLEPARHDALADVFLVSALGDGVFRLSGGGRHSSAFLWIGAEGVQVIPGAVALAVREYTQQELARSAAIMSRSAGADRSRTHQRGFALKVAAGLEAGVQLLRNALGEVSLGRLHTCRSCAGDGLLYRGGRCRDCRGLGYREAAAEVRASA